ncbi:MAG: GxxExxY protein [Leptospirales bacterium]
MDLELSELTELVIGASINVHKKLGPGFLESIYEKAMVIELIKNNIQIEQQKGIPIYYDQLRVGEHRLDLLIEKTIVVELKAVNCIHSVYFSIVRSYLKALNLKHGLIINFNKAVIEVKRVIYEIK